MEEFANSILKAIPTMRRLDHIAEMEGDKVMLNGKYAGISDKQEGGYIRRDGDIQVESKKVASDVTNSLVTEPFCIVVGWRKGSVVSYLNKLLSIMAQDSRVEVQRMELNKTKIIEEETGEESTNMSYQLGKIEFTMFREVASGDCLTIDCK